MIAVCRFESAAFSLKTRRLRKPSQQSPAALPA